MESYKFHPLYRFRPDNYFKRVSARSGPGRRCTLCKRKLRGTVAFCWPIFVSILILLYLFFTPSPDKDFLKGTKREMVNSTVSSLKAPRNLTKIQNEIIVGRGKGQHHVAKGQKGQYREDGELEISFNKFADTDYLTFVPASLIHIAYGVKPIESSDDIILQSQRKRQIDTVMSKSTRTTMTKYLNNLRELTQGMEKTMMNKSLSTFMGASQALPSDVRDFLNDWRRKRLSPNDVFTITFTEYLKHLKLLTDRPFPEDPRPESCDNCFSMDEYKFTIEPRIRACDENKELSLIILATSTPKEALARMAIRQTWGRWTMGSTAKSKLVFLFGSGWTAAENEQLVKESISYGDILQADFRDHYYNLTYKVLQGYKWVIQNCKNVKFVVRAADDTFVHVPNLHRFLSSFGDLRSYKDFQIGHCIPRMRTPRFPWFKNHFSTYEYIYDLIPPYALGSIFMTSLDLTKRILEHSRNVPYFPVEDIYFALLLRQIGSGCLHLEGFIGHQKFRGKDYTSKIYFTSHPEPSERLSLIFNFFLGRAKFGRVHNEGKLTNSGRAKETVERSEKNKYIDALAGSLMMRKG